MAAASEYVLEPIRDGAEFTLYRARQRGNPSPVLVLAPTGEQPLPRKQTGRMNRSMDTRSDLYSLGVTLYEMLTGVLPFAAADPLERVHCHIARQPVPPAGRRAVPEPLSAITMRLLAKNAEERYQTAAGLEAIFGDACRNGSRMDASIHSIWARTTRRTYY